MKTLRWHDYLSLNSYWFGLNVVTASLTPIIVPLLVQHLVGETLTNSYYGALRAAGLLVAIFVQPIAGLLSDRSTSRFGRRRPFILLGTVLSILSLWFVGEVTSYWALLTAILLGSAAANVSQGALQGLIPDLVPTGRRGRASAAKAVMELLPIAVVAFSVARWVDRGLLGRSLAFCAAALGVTVVVTIVAAREAPLRARPPGAAGQMVARVLEMLVGILLGLAVASAVGGLLFVLVGTVTTLLGAGALALVLALVMLGASVIVGTIVIGVWACVEIATSGISGLASRVSASTQSRGLAPTPAWRGAFTWWVTNRLFFLAAASSISGFALYFLQSVVGVSPDRLGAETGELMLVLGVTTAISAASGGYLADRFGRRRVVQGAGLLAFVATAAIAVQPALPVVTVAGLALGIAAGAFYAASWALGADLVPPGEAARFLGISNLAGAGAGMVGAGLGGLLVDRLRVLVGSSGYQWLFAVYALCFALSAIVLVRVPETQRAQVEAQGPH